MSGTTTTTTPNRRRRVRVKETDKLHAQNAHFASPPSKPRNQYDQMIYETFLEPSSSEHFKDTTAKFPIMIQTSSTKNKKKSHKEHNLAQIPGLVDDGGGLDEGGSGSQESTKESSGGSQRENANSLIEAKSKFRSLLAAKREELYPNASRPKLNLNIKSRTSKRRAAAVAAASSFSQTSSQVSGDTSEATSDLDPYIDPKMILFSPLDPDNFIFERNKDKYTRLLNGVRRGKATPYQVGQAWAHEHFGRFEMQQPNVPPPPLPPVGSNHLDFDGPYSEIPEGIYHLPAPEPLPVDPTTGAPLCLRLPAFIRNRRPPGRPFKDIAAELNSQVHLPISVLLQEHKSHWRNTRKAFLAAEAQNRSRYHHSFRILERIYVSPMGSSSYGGGYVEYFKTPPYDQSMFVVKEEEGEEEEEETEDFEEMDSGKQDSEMPDLQELSLAQGGGESDSG